jgi:hypothetical protein
MFGPLNVFLDQQREVLGFQVLELPGGCLLKLPAVADAGLDLGQLRQGWKQALAQVRVAVTQLVNCTQEDAC